MSKNSDFVDSPSYDRFWPTVDLTCLDLTSELTCFLGQNNLQDDKITPQLPVFKILDQKIVKIVPVGANFCKNGTKTLIFRPKMAKFGPFLAVKSNFIENFQNAHGGKFFNGRKQPQGVF